MTKRTDAKFGAFIVWRRAEGSTWRRICGVATEADGERFVSGQRVAGDKCEFAVTVAGEAPPASSAVRRTAWEPFRDRRSSRSVVTKSKLPRVSVRVGSITPRR